MKKIHVKPGDVYGALEIVRETGSDQHMHRLFEVKCLCGRSRIKTLRHVMVSTQGCGHDCPLYRKYVGDRSRTHGLSHDALHTVWRDMLRRCLDPKNPSFKHYGQRGIAVDDAWREYTNFHNDMADSYAKGLELDRVDNDGMYCKSNCRWTTRTVQMRNTRRSVTPGWVLDEAARNGLSRTTVRGRIKRGWNPQQACTEPARTYAQGRRIPRHSVAPSWVLNEAAKNKIARTTLYQRIHLGWPLDRACTEPVRSRAPHPAVPGQPDGS